METEFKKMKAVMETPVPVVTEVPDGVTQARQHLMKAANLYVLCMACVNKAIAPHAPPIVQTSEFFQAAVATLFIEASRMRFVEKMPNRPL